MVIIMEMYDLNPINEITHMGYDRGYENRYLNELSLSELKNIEASTKKEKPQDQTRS